MTTRLAIAFPATRYSSGFGRQGTRRAREDRPPARSDRPSGASETTRAGDGAFTPEDRARFRRPRHGFIDALVTLTVIGWLTATVALMVGELYGVAPAAIDPTTVASAATAAAPSVHAGSAEARRAAPASL